MRGTALGLAGMGVAQIIHTRGVTGNGTRGLGQRTHGHQHALDIGMVDDRHGAGGSLNGPALHAVARIGQRMLRCTLAHADALHADSEPRGVHHDEHVLQTAVFLTDQSANGAWPHVALAIAKQKDCGRASVDAQLVFNRGAPDIIALAQGAIVVDEELRHDEQRDALDPGWRIGRARQHEVDNVLGQVMLAVGNENLLPENPESAVTLRNGAGIDQRQIRTGLRLGQVHCACPLGAHQAIDVGLFLRIGARKQQCLDDAVGEHRAEGKRDVGSVQVLGRGRRKQRWQPLASPLLGMPQALPSAFGVLRESLAKRFRRMDHAILPLRGILVAIPVGRGHDLFGEARVFLKHRVDQVRFDCRKGGQFEQFGQACEVLENETKILNWRAKCHGGSDGCVLVNRTTSHMTSQRRPSRGGQKNPAVKAGFLAACEIPNRDQSELTSSGTAVNRSATRP